MNYFKIISLTSLIICLLSCSDNKSGSQSDIQIESLKRNYKIVDSLKLFTDSTSFEYLNIDKIKNDTVLAFQYPILNLSLLNSNGRFIKEINRQGNLKGNFSGQFIDSKWFEDYLFVLEEGMKFGIIIYDKNLKFIKAVNFNKYFLNSFVFPKVTSFEIIRKKKNIEIILSIANDKYNYYKPDYYLNTNSIAIIEMKDMEVQNVKFGLPYKNFDSVNKFIADDERTWNNPNVLFQYSDNLLYLKYNFDDLIYVVDINEYKIINTIKINTVYAPKKKEFVSFSKPEMTPKKAVKEMMKLSYTNSELQSFLLKKDKIFALYNVPTDNDKIQENPSGLNKMNVKLVIYVIDLKTKKQSHYIFNDSYSFSTFYTDGDFVYLTSNQFITENPYLYKIKLL